MGHLLLGRARGAGGARRLCCGRDLDQPCAHSFLSAFARAGEALIGPVGAITATSLALIPGQPAALPGAEVIAVGLVIVIAPIAFQSRTWGLRKEAAARERIVRAATNEGFNLTFLIGGALLFAGAPAGLSWIAAGDILCIIAIVLSAWVLMVEILR